MCTEGKLEVEENFYNFGKRYIKVLVVKILLAYVWSLIPLITHLTLGHCQWVCDTVFLTGNDSLY